MKFVVVLFLLLSIGRRTVESAMIDGLKVVASETFDNGTLNSALWSVGYPWGTYFNSRANMIPRLVKVTSQGFLTLTAIKERSISLGLQTEFGSIDLDFSSGAIKINEKYCIKNGYVEVRMKSSNVTTTWPSVFLVARDQTLPIIQLMEVYDDRSRYGFSFKFTDAHDQVQQVEGIATGRQTDDDFHRFGVDWGYDQVTWLYDDYKIMTLTQSKELEQVNEMCLVIAQGVGGKSTSPINPRDYPATMFIDSITIWKPEFDGYFKFQNLHTGLLMTVENASHANNQRIIQWPDNGANWQVWHVQYAGHGQYRLLAAHSRKALDASDWQHVDGTSVIQYDYHSSNNQLWKIYDVWGEPGIVQLVSVHAFDATGDVKYISVPDRSTQPGTPLHLWSDVGNNDGNWKMIQL